jgi:phosphotransferase system HPr (HPr) family protein
MVVLMKKTMTIINEAGLHTRAALQIVQVAQKASHGVWVSKDDQRADATSVIDLLTLYCPKGSAVTLEIDHSHDNQIFDEIVSRIENGFGE